MERTLEWMIYYTYLYMTSASFDEGSVYWAKDMVLALNVIIDRAIKLLGSEWKGMKYFHQKGNLKCEKVMKKCQFNQRQFPCCQTENDNFTNPPSVCYKIDASCRSVLE
jgi:hypothetical protein